jgi:hypothetical protein
MLTAEELNRMHHFSTLVVAGRLKKGRLVRTVAGWLSISLVLMSLIACSGYQSPIIDLVPLDSCAVLVVDWSAVRNDVELRRLFKGDQFEATLQQLALESASVKTLVVFSSMNSRVKSGMLLRGSFDKQKQVSALKARGWREESIDGHKVYVSGNDYAAMPNSAVLFAGSREAAAAVFRALTNSQESFRTSRSYQKISAAMTTQNNPVKAFLVIPDGTLDMANAALEATAFALSLFDLGGVGTLLKQLNVASGFGLSLAHGSNQSYPLEMCVLMRDEKAAAFVNGSLNAMKRLSTMASANNRDQEALRALQGMTITRKDEVLAIKVSMPRAVLIPSNAP